MLAALGGALYFLGFLGFGIWPLLAVFLVPLWWSLERAPGAGAAALAGLVFGAVAYAGGYPWLWRLVDVFLGGSVALGAALWTAHGLWFAAGYAAYAVSYRALRRRGGPVLLAGGAPLLLVQWLQPQLFPVHAGSALAAFPLLAQSAELGGPLLLSAWVVAFNAAAFAGLGGAGPRRVRAWLAAAGLAVALVGYGAIRAAAVAEGSAAAPSLRVGLVQAELGLLEKRTRPALSHERHLAQTRTLLEDGAVDLVVWPETAYGRGIRRPLPVAGAPIRAEIAVPLLFGATSVEERGGRRRRTNAAFLVGADGMVRDAYDKIRLIPVAESVPLAGLLPGLASWFPHGQDFAPGDGVAALRLGDWRLVAPICHEVVHADLVRRMVREVEPHLLVTLANDAWFGDSHEPWIHLGLARLRAIEHRRALVRATNSGISAVVDPAGALLARSGLQTRENLRATVPLWEGLTPYARLGDWPGWLALAGCALGLLAKPRAHGAPADAADAGSIAGAPG